MGSPNLQFNLNSSQNQLSNNNKTYNTNIAMHNYSVKVFATFAFCFCLINITSASSSNSVLENTEETQKAQANARTIFTSGGTYYLALNTTYLIYYGILIGLGLLAAFALASIGAPSSTSSYNSYGSQYSRASHIEGDEFLIQRQKRYIDDIASKMAQLEQAFKKYQVEEAECEMYIACEASQVQRIEENGPLARIVYDILSTFNRSKDGHKWDDRMDGLVKAFEFGTGASASGQVDPCQPLRNKCFELHAKY